MEIENAERFENLEKGGFDEDSKGGENAVGVGELTFEGGDLVEILTGLGVKNDFEMRSEDV